MDRQKIKQLNEAKLSIDQIANILDGDPSDVVMALELLRREDIVKERQRRQYNANYKSTGWANGKLDNGNRVKVPVALATSKGFARTINQSVFGDPQPHHIALRESRA